MFSVAPQANGDAFDTGYEILTEFLSEKKNIERNRFHYKSVLVAPS